jgi:toxin CptA
MPSDIFYFLIAFALAGLLGFAIQRGGTCTVAAIDEIVIHRRGSRFFALLEAAVWVAGGLFIFWSLKLDQQPIISWDITWLTVLGAALLGLGAVINGACIVGTISRIGNLEWMFSFTLLGFLAGSMAFYGLHLDVYLPSSQTREAFRLIPPWLIGLIAAGMLARLFYLRKHLWHFRMATIVIAIAQLLLRLVYGPWAFSDFLIDLAKTNEVINFVPRLLLFMALLGGAIWGGFTKTSSRPMGGMHLQGMIQRLMGGALMGAGSLMVPGSHDSLVLFYLPLLLPFAFVTYTVMILTIAISKFWIYRQSRMDA